MAALLAAAGCDGNGGTPPENLRFGQLGEMQVELLVPRADVGSLHQTLVWESSGAWRLTEYIGYRGRVGDETVVASQGDPSPLAAPYASVVATLDGVEGLKLFIEGLWPDTVGQPTCGQTRTRVTFTIRDHVRDASASWVRCADGSLSNITPVGAGPDAAASRIVTAVQMVRNETLSPDFLSAYHGSVPFGTLDRGQDTQAPLSAPLYFLDQPSWQGFWVDHTGSSEAPPVDFTKDMVVVAAVGVREEAGDSVEVRRILQVDNGTLTEVYERRPGDFCSPAARFHRPYHAVVAPRTALPVRFADTRIEYVACGG